MVFFCSVTWEVRATDHERRAATVMVYTLFSLVTGPKKTAYAGARKNHDSQRRDRILRFFLHLEIGQFFHILG